MRTEFIDELTRLAAEDDRICLVVGDLGFGVVQDFARRFPDRFLNAGIAEQSMTGVAAGWALSGKVVFTYSIANFPTLRCLEQIRNDACDHRADVKVAAVGGGFAYGALGASHHATEDLAILRALPGIAVVAPGDTVEARLATRAVADLPGPCYLRLGRAGEPTVHAAEPDFRLGRAITVRDGDDLTLISTGGMLKATVEAADLLAAEGFMARVLSMHTLRPLDDEAVERAAVETGALVTVEEHSVDRRARRRGRRGPGRAGGRRPAPSARRAGRPRRPVRRPGVHAPPLRPDSLRDRRRRPRPRRPGPPRPSPRRRRLTRPPGISKAGPLRSVPEVRKTLLRPARHRRGRAEGSGSSSVPRHLGGVAPPVETTAHASQRRLFQAR